MKSLQNSGGRVSYTIGEPVKILNVDGTISQEHYSVNQEKSDRNGIILLVNSRGQEFKVSFRRIIPVDVKAQACVLEAGDKYKIVCPFCRNTEVVKHRDNTHTCNKCNETSECYWLTTKPIAINMKAIQKKEKTVKEVPAQTEIDFKTLVSIEGIKLYTKRNVTFDHPKVNVQAHVIICTLTDPPRKLCFNSYNGTLGKKQAELPIKELMNGGESSKFFEVKNLEATEKQLLRNGYEEVLP